VLELRREHRCGRLRALPEGRRERPLVVARHAGDLLAELVLGLGAVVRLVQADHDHARDHRGEHERPGEEEGEACSK
jgi:hypothetical protein